MDAPRVPEAGVPNVVERLPTQEPSQGQQQQQSSLTPAERNSNRDAASADEAAVRSPNYTSNGYSSDPRGNHYATELNTPSLSYQPQPPSASRPPSSGVSSGTDRQKQVLQPAKNSVVIKVGMVGDAQIGKTSLMVKYVEGSWDEDYIQTLGEF